MESLFNVLCLDKYFRIKFIKNNYLCCLKTLLIWKMLEKIITTKNVLNEKGDFSIEAIVGDWKDRK